MPGSFRRVLVMRFSSVGDVVLASPAIHALKRARPTTEIAWAIHQSCAPLIAHDPSVDRVVALSTGESFGAFHRRLREVQADAVLDLQGKLRTRVLRALLPGRKVVWKKRPWRDNLPVRWGWRPYRAQMLIADRYHRAVEALLGESIPRGELRAYVGEAEQAEADAALAQAGIDPASPVVGLSPGAKWETKRWPLERYAALAGRLVERGTQVVVTGSPDERPLAARIRETVPDAADLTGAVSLGALLGVINRCATYIANDSGPMHIARALGVPTLTFFGSTDPKQFDFEGHHALFEGIACSPCHFYGRRACPKKHFRCMLDIDVERAWSALAALLDAPRRPYVQG